MMHNNNKRAAHHRNCLQTAEQINSLHGRQVTQNDVHSMNRVGADRFLQVYWF